MTPEPDLFPKMDHYHVSFQLNENLNIQKVEHKLINFRNTKSINNDVFKTDLNDALTNLAITDKEFIDAINTLYSKCSTFLDKHAPVLTRKI